MRALALVTMALTAAVLVACGGAGEAAPQAEAAEETMADEPQLVGVEWVAVSIAGQPAHEEVRSTINFDDEGLAFGEAGCNTFRGAYELEGDGISFGPMASTRMFCEGPRQEQEDRYLAALATVERYAIVGGELLLHPAGDDEPIRFTAVETSAD